MGRIWWLLPRGKVMDGKGNICREPNKKQTPFSWKFLTWTRSAITIVCLESSHWNLRNFFFSNVSFFKNIFLKNNRWNDLIIKKKCESIELWGLQAKKRPSSANNQLSCSDILLLFRTSPALPNKSPASSLSVLFFLSKISSLPAVFLYNLSLLMGGRIPAISSAAAGRAERGGGLRAKQAGRGSCRGS
jgi:hypothetical protein